MSEEWITTEFVGAQYITDFGEEEMLGDQRGYSVQSAILRTVCKNNPEEKEKEEDEEKMY